MITAGGGGAKGGGGGGGGGGRGGVTREGSEGRGRRESPGTAGGRPPRIVSNGELSSMGGGPCRSRTSNGRVIGATTRTRPPHPRARRRRRSRTTTSTRSSTRSTTSSRATPRSSSRDSFRRAASDRRCGPGGRHGQAPGRLPDAGVLLVHRVPRRARPASAARRARPAARHGAGGAARDDDRRAQL